MTLSHDLPNYVLFASAAKHLMDSAVHSERMARDARDYWQRRLFRNRAKRQRFNAWDFLAAARTSREMFQ